MKEIEEKPRRIRVVKLGEVNRRLGKVEKRVWEEKRKKILSYLEGKGNLSSDIGEEMCDGEEGMGKTKGRFPSDSVLI